MSCQWNNPPLDSGSKISSLSPLQTRFRSMQTFASMDGEFLTSAEASQKLWPSGRQACWLLVWYGLLVMPLHCAAGHEWKSFNSNSEKGNLFLHCTERIPNPEYHGDDEDDEIPKKKLCNKKLTWRRPGTIPTYLATNFLPAQYLASLYWFASDSSYKTARKQAGVSQKNWLGFVSRIRNILRLSVVRLSPVQLGGAGKIVCVEETFLTKKKTCKGVFRGRATAGTKKIVLGMPEWDLSTRKATGRCLLVDRQISSNFEDFYPQAHCCWGFH